MHGLDVIGAGENLSAYTILVRIRSIDTAKLQAKAGSGVIPGAIAMANEMPQLALETALPVVKAQVEKIGITADFSIAQTQKAPKAGAPHEMAVVLGVGAALGGMLALIVPALYHLAVPVSK